MVADFDVEFIERDDRNARFLVRGATPAFANGVRRAMIADVPTFSIDTVRFVENSSVMFDEMIGLRLGLVPLSTPLDDFEVGDEVTLALDVEGPATAYSGDIVSSDEMVRLVGHERNSNSRHRRDERAVRTERRSTHGDDT